MSTEFPVDVLASLARLNLTPEEAEHFGEQLPAIIDYVGQLKTAETEAVPNADPLPSNVRPDEAKPSASGEAILDQAPERLEHFWKVKSVF